MKKSNPKLSIIVPMYNAENTVSECIESILNQEFREYELILVDDGSTDNTLNICKMYAEKDQRIIIVPLEKNMGLINARKTGVEIAKAEYIGFVDSDDWIERDMYSNLINIQEKFDCDLISSGIYRDYIEEKYCYDDLQAVISFAKEIQKLFVFKEVNENRRLMYTIEYNLPSSLNFESDVNLFRKMSDNYMTDFKEKIDDLVDNLEAVKSETDEVEQCKMLSKIFGDDFPIPEKKNAAKKQMNFIPSTSASGVD